MALIKCSECGKEISDKAKICVKCGNPINTNQESKVFVYGYTENYIINPAVKIFQNNEEIGKVEKGQVFEKEILEDCTLTFKCSMRKSSVQIKAGQITKIKISWNRLTGQMVPQIIDYNVADNSKW